MNRPYHMQIIDEAFEEYKKNGFYEALVKPWKDKMQYPDNFVRRIFDDAFCYGRISKRNYPLTEGEKITLQNNWYKETRRRFKK